MERALNLKPIFHCDAKPFALGPCVGLDPQRHNFALGIPTCWYLKTLKFGLPPTLTPNTSRWNIGGVGSPKRAAGVGHIDFMLFTSYSLVLGTQCKPSFQWNTGLTHLTFGQRKQVKGAYLSQTHSVHKLTAWVRGAVMHY